MVVPDNNSWEAIYDSVYNYFNYSYIDKADSIQNYWANYSLIQDMVFNPKEQKIKEDSLMSTTYVTNGYSYNVYYRPYDEGGLLNNIKEDMQCSNGVIHKLDYWPFDFTKLFFKPIKLEAERTMNIIKSDYGVYSTNYSAADSISGNAYLKMTPSSNGVKNYVQYNIPNTLSGKYDIAVVILPKTVFDENDRNKDKPFLFSAELTYKDVDGKEQSFEFTDYNNISPNGYVNDPARVDTVFVGSFDFPTCNYAQNNIAVTLKITSIANARQTTTYTKEGYLDFIYLKPHVE